MKAKDHLAEGSPITDPEIYHWRTIILVGALSSLAIKHEASPCLELGDYDALKAWLLRHDHHFSIWGEGAIASLVPWLVWTQKHEATLRSDLQIDAITKFVIRSNQKDSKAALANPYHSFESLYRQLLPFEKPSKTGEQFAGMSHTALVLFHLLVRTNLKQSCKVLWPDLTTLHHRSLVPDSPWEYCHLAVRSGIDETLVLASEGQWATLRIDAREDCRAAIPPELGRRPWLLGLWWQLAPQRLTPDASRVFANALLPEWGS